jgi:hypothetical protein
MSALEEFTNSLFLENLARQLGASPDCRVIWLPDNMPIRVLKYPSRVEFHKIAEEADPQMVEYEEIHLQKYINLLTRTIFNVVYYQNVFYVHKEKGAEMTPLDLLTTRLIQADFQPNLEKLQKEGARELSILRTDLAAKTERIAELEARCEWQPIETAPPGLEHKEILEFIPGFGVFVVHQYELCHSKATHWKFIEPPKEPR